MSNQGKAKKDKGERDDMKEERLTICASTQVDLLLEAILLEGLGDT